VTFFKASIAVLLASCAAVAISLDGAAIAGARVAGDDVRLIPATATSSFVAGEDVPRAEVRGLDGAVSLTIFRADDTERKDPVRAQDASVVPAGTRVSFAEPLALPGAYEMVVQQGSATADMGLTVLDRSARDLPTTPGAFGINAGGFSAPESESLPDEVFDVIPAVNASTVRFDIAWQGVERHPSGAHAASCSSPEAQQFDFSTYDRRIRAALDGTSAKPLIVLLGGNSYWTETKVVDGRDVVGPPLASSDPACADRFAAFAAATAAHYAAEFDGGLTFEVWNEWFTNSTRVWGPDAASASSYQDLLAPTYRAITAAAGDAATVIGSSAGVVTQHERDWFDAWVSAGGLDSVDGVSLHPYQAYGRPGDCAAVGPCVVGGLAWISDRIDEAGFDRPLFVTEFGYTLDEFVGVPPRSPIAAAALLARAAILSQQYDVPVFDAFEAWDRNAGDFGLLSDDMNRFESRPAYAAWGTLSRELSGMRFLGSVDRPGVSGADAVRVVTFFDEVRQRTVRAFWNVGDGTADDVGQRVPIELPTGIDATLTSSDGLRSSVPASGSSTVTSRFAPQYLTSHGAAPVTVPVRATEPSDGSTVAAGRPVFSGVGEPGASITVAGTTTVIASTVVAADGSWSVRSDRELPANRYALTVEQTMRGTTLSTHAITITVLPGAPLGFVR
jgi:hypothetical protein